MSGQQRDWQVVFFLRLLWKFIWNDFSFPNTCIVFILRGYIWNWRWSYKSARFPLTLTQRYTTRRGRGLRIFVHRKLLELQMLHHMFGPIYSEKWLKERGDGETLQRKTEIEVSIDSFKHCHLHHTINNDWRDFLQCYDADGWPPKRQLF